MLKVVCLSHFTPAGLTLSSKKEQQGRGGGLIKADLVYGQPPPNLTKGRLRKSLSHHVALV